MQLKNILFTDQEDLTLYVDNYENNIKCFFKREKHSIQIKDICTCTYYMYIYRL